MVLEIEKCEALIPYLERIFTLPMSRSTFREVQNAILLVVQGNVSQANAFIDTVLSNEEAIPSEIQALIRPYLIPIRVAKEVHDRGDALSLLTTDLGVQGESLVFSTRIRRVDGTEFHFFTDTEGVFQVVEHLLARLKDGEKTPQGKNIFRQLSSRIDTLQRTIDDLHSSDS